MNAIRAENGLLRLERASIHPGVTRENTRPCIPAAIKFLSVGR